jgi:hypothetical protein
MFIPMHRGAGGFPDEATPDNVMALREAADEYGVFLPRMLRQSPTRAGRPNPAGRPRAPYFFERRARPLELRPALPQCPSRTCESQSPLATNSASQAAQR